MFAPQKIDFFVDALAVVDEAEPLELHRALLELHFTVQTMPRLPVEAVALSILVNSIDEV